MSTVRELHDKAVELMLKGDELTALGHDASTIYYEASVIEEEAATQIPFGSDSEPTRSILYLSSASSAWLAKDLSRAEKLVHIGLQGTPPKRVRSDLYILLDDIRYGLSVENKIVQLDEASVDMRLYGERVRFGTAPFRAVFERLDSFSKLFSRTYQRLCSLPYEDGRKKSAAIIPYSYHISISAPASFGVTIKLTREAGQSIPLLGVTAEKVILDVLSCIEMIDKNDVESLKIRIADEKYLTNFLSLTGSIAPDGNKINMVGLTTKNFGVSFRSVRSEVRSRAKTVHTVDEIDDTPFKRGYLDIANRKTGILQFTDENGDVFDTSVKEGLEDLVKSYFGSLVDVEFERKRSKLVLVGIEPIEDD